MTTRPCSHRSHRALALLPSAALLAFLAGLPPLLTACASAATAGGSPDVAADRAFVAKMARHAGVEAEFGALATHQADDPRVQDLGRALHDDWTQNADQLRPLAARLGIALPAPPTHKQRWDHQELARQVGQYFDRYYVNIVMEYQIRNLRALKHEARHTADADLRRFALALVPACERDLDAAQRLIPTYGYGRTYGGDVPQ